MSKHTDPQSSESVQAQGGRARADKLNPEKRAQIAASAAAARWGIPAASHVGTVQIGPYANCQCYNVEIAGKVERLISQSSFMDIMGIVGGPKRCAYLTGHLLDNPVIPPKRVAAVRRSVENPIKFMTKEGFLVHGYEGKLIVDYCKALMDARSLGALPDYALPYALACEKVVIALAGVGIAALIDEATGFQEIRDRRALETLLDKYLRKEFSDWAKRFPDDFYQEIFRLRGWEWKGMAVNRPSFVGKLTNDIVYERIETGLVTELQKRNPWSLEKTRREGYHHCLLTEDLGVPKLAQHLYAVVALMKASKDWRGFYKSLQMVFPKKGEVIQLDFEDLEEA